MAFGYSARIDKTVNAVTDLAIITIIRAYSEDRLTWPGMLETDHADQAFYPRQFPRYREDGA